MTEFEWTTVKDEFRWRLHRLRWSSILAHPRLSLRALGGLLGFWIPRRYWVVTDGGAWCAYDSKEDAAEELAYFHSYCTIPEDAGMAEHLAECEAVEHRIESRWFTPLRLWAAGEFQGW